jgi:hypothetical protein
MVARIYSRPPYTWASIAPPTEMIFDWVAAACIISDLRDRGACIGAAFAGLSGRWGSSCILIYRHGLPYFSKLETPASFCDAPLLKIGEYQWPCWTPLSRAKFNRNTKWPSEALNVLIPGNEALVRSLVSGLAGDSSSILPSTAPGLFFPPIKWTHTRSMGIPYPSARYLT